MSEAPDRPAEDAAKRLARAVRTRLAEIHVSGRALSRAGYIPSATLGRLLRGDSFPRRDFSGLERGLGWARDSAYQVASGKDPTVVLVLRGQPVHQGQVMIQWPPARDQAETSNWRDVVEAAWKQVEDGNTGHDHALPARPASEDQTRWLLRRTTELPAWLANRIQAVLIAWEAQRRGDEPPDVFALADRIMALDRAREVLTLLMEWRDRLHQDTD